MRGVGCRAVSAAASRNLCVLPGLRVRAGLASSFTACSLRAREARLPGLSRAFLTGAELTWQSPGSILSRHCPVPPE